MVKNKNQVNEAWSIIDVFLKKRYDLIPNLVNIVKGYATHENETLTEIARMRNQAMQSTEIKERVETETKLDGALAKLFVSVENYPDLKANENFIRLQSQLSSIEDDIEKSRRYYNGTVRENNIYISKVFRLIWLQVCLVFRKNHFSKLIQNQEKRLLFHFNRFYKI